MTAKYARLLAERFDLEPSANPTDRYLWAYVYPCILRAIQRGEVRCVINSELSDPVIEILVKQKYLVTVASCPASMHANKMTTISWEKP